MNTNEIKNNKKLLIVFILVSFCLMLFNIFQLTQNQFISITKKELIKENLELTKQVEILQMKLKNH